jgi:hypothetical protein
MKLTHDNAAKIARDRRQFLIGLAAINFVWIVGEIAHAYLF